MDIAERILVVRGIKTKFPSIGMVYTPFETEAEISFSTLVVREHKGERYLIPVIYRALVNHSGTDKAKDFFYSTCVQVNRDYIVDPEKEINIKDL